MDKAAPSKRARQKRNRIITACFDCRERKAGCDRKKPICSRCRDGRTCIYLDPPHNALINGVSEKVSNLNVDVREKVQRLYSQCLGDAKDDGDGSDIEGLEASPLVTESASYDDDVDETEVTDLGFHVGKLHLTDRIGGQYRPGMAQELKMLLQATGHQREWAEEQEIWPSPPGIFDVGTSSPTASFLQPSSSYLAPNLDPLSMSKSRDTISYLPPHRICVRILQQYWLSVHSLTRVLHRPSFEKRWQTFATCLTSKVKPVKSLQALVFSILFSGIVAMPDQTLDQEMGEDQQLWMTSLKAGTEKALTEAQVFQTSKVETLQAFVTYLIVLCRDEVSRIHSSLVAAAIRIAECNGLHCDGEQRGYNALETHVRRLIWFNLCFLDIRTAEAQGPRPIIVVENYTTKFPANINDSDITVDGVSASSDSRWTEMTLPLIRFQCNEFIRSIWVMRRKLIAREITVTSVLNSIESFRSEWSLKFSPDKPDDPLQRYGTCLLDLQSARTYAMVLHPYHIHPKLQMPDRLLSILIENGIRTMDRVIEVEALDAYSPWRWYAGAIQQHHYALLMAVEIIMNPRRKDSGRIWHGLDYVFEPPSNLAPVARARWIISQSWWKMEVYLGKRSLRAPINLEQNLREALRLSDQESQRGERQSTASSGSTLKDNSPEPHNTAISTKQHLKGNERRKKKAEPPASKLSAPDMAYPSDGATTLSSGSIPSGQAEKQSPQGGPKQIVDVDWGILNNYYPPEQFTGDLDVPFGTWSHLLQSTPFPTSSTDAQFQASAPNQYRVNVESKISSFPAPEQMAYQKWTGLWPSSTDAGSMQAPAFSNAPTNLQPQAPPMSNWNTPGSTFPLTQDLSAQWAAFESSGLTPRPQDTMLQRPWAAGGAQDYDNRAVNMTMPQNDVMPVQQRKRDEEVNFGMGIYRPIPRDHQ